MKYGVFLFDSQLQATYAAECYNAAQLAHLAESHRKEWLQRINCVIIDLHRSGNHQMRDKYMSLRKQVNSATVVA